MQNFFNSFNNLQDLAVLVTGGELSTVPIFSESVYVDVFILAIFPFLFSLILETNFFKSMAIRLLLLLQKIDT